MKPGSVIVDLAAEQGGNCELTVRRGGGAPWRHHHRLYGSGEPPGQAILDAVLEQPAAHDRGSVQGEGRQRRRNFEDDAIRGLTVIKAGELTCRRRRQSCPLRPPSSSPPRRSPRPRAGVAPASRCRRRRWRWYSASARCCSCSSACTRGRLPGALHGVRAGLLRRLHGGLECDPSLHTPLMSVTNAISSIIAIGALVQVAPPLSDSVEPTQRPDPGLAVFALCAHGRQHVRRLRSDARRMLAMFRK